MKIPDSIKIAARELRNNMTPAEKDLWEEIRRGKILGKQFQRQKPIKVLIEDSGQDRYIIPDFICLEGKLILELDGEIHNIPEIYNLDREKELLLKNLGYKILRFKNKEIHENKNKVLEKIAASFK